MKIIFPTGEIFEGTMEEFKVFYKEYKQNLPNVKCENENAFVKKGIENACTNEDSKGMEKSNPISLQTPIEELDLSVRALNCLKRDGIGTVKDLTEKTEDEVANVRCIGEKAFKEVSDKLHSLGFDFRVDLSNHKENNNIALCSPGKKIPPEVNKRLINVIFKNDPRKHLLKDGALNLNENAACGIRINENATLFLIAIKGEKIQANLLYKTNSIDCLITTKNFNCDERNEEFELCYNKKTFYSIVDKKRTTKKMVWIREHKSVENDEIYHGKPSSDSEEISRLLIQLTLQVLNEFIERLLGGLTIRDFGYINF